MNSNFTTNNSLYHLQKGPDGINILKDPLKRTDEGLGCKERAYIRRGTLQKRGEGHFRRKKEQMREQRNTLQSIIILTYKYKIYHWTHPRKLSIIELLVHSLLFIS